MGLWWVAYRLQVLQSPADTYWIRDWVLLSAVTSLCTIVILTGTLVETLRSAAVASLTTVVVLEGMFNNVYLSPDAWDMFDHPPPYVRTLQQEAGLNRVLTFAALNANLSSAFEIFSLDSVMAFNAPRMHALYMRYTGALPAQFLREARHIPPELVLDRANIRMVAIRDAFPEQVHAARARGYSVRFNDGYVWLFERPTQPRFFFSSEYRVSPASEVLEAVASAPARQILLEERPLFQSEPNTPDDPPVQVESYRRNSVRIRVNAPRPGLVYASESFFDGWTARVNGTVTRILPANYAFRAVPVRAGSSVIDFHYRPPGLRAGLAGSGVSVLLLVAVCVFWSNTPGSST
jgi:hypothetical protein